ncbi:hypothetical protein [Sarcina sp. DSM 11001]|uniref:hypothetical protein n=1 Tax=Sarcina sp. DSM 11001 TaxID=1798184 RepID=UPI000B84603C|nr:hypothetical protein [Sarcina sp. DSM 11001]
MPVDVVAQEIVGSRVLAVAWLVVLVIAEEAAVDLEAKASYLSICESKAVCLIIQTDSFFDNR